jgi:hypothetical protein
VTSGYDAVVSQGIKTSFYVGGSIKTPIKCLSVGVAYDYVGLANNTTTDPETGDPISHSSGYQNATALYLLWHATDKLTFNTRADYFTQSEYLTTPGMPKDVFALTETVQYELWKNVISRLEFRWDHSLSGTAAYGGTAANSAPSLENAFLVAANVIYKF